MAISKYKKLQIALDWSLEFPFEVDGIVALHVALHMDLLALGHRNLFRLRLKVGGHWGVRKEAWQLGLGVLYVV